MKLASASKALFQKLSNFEFNSGIGRQVLGRYYRVGNVYTVAFGALRGTKLRYDGTLNYHSMLGLTDLRNFSILRKALTSSGILKPGMIAADVGANVGLYSLWLSRLLSQNGDGKVYAFEPNPSVANVLTTHLDLNHITNVEVVRLGVSDHVGKTEFHISPNHATSSLLRNLAGENHGADSHIVSIELTTMDDYFIAGNRPAPDFIKMDIEGAAEMALKKCGGCLAQKRPMMLVESHSSGEDKAIQAIVQNLDYKAFRLSNLEWVKNPAELHPHPDGIWGNHILCPAEHFAKVKAALP